MGVLAASLRGHRCGGPLQDLEQGLLHALARHVAGDRRVLRLTGDLVDLVDVDDARLRLLDVVVGGLDQLEQDVLDVFADIAGLGERRRISDGKGYVEHPGQGLGQQGLAAAGGPEQQDVGLGQLNVGVAPRANLHPLVVVVDRHREDLLGVLLADDVVVEEVVDVLGLGQLVEAELSRLGQLLFDDLVAQVDALVTDVDARAGDELLHLLLRLPTEGALQKVPATIADPRHLLPRSSNLSEPMPSPQRRAEPTLVWRALRR